MERLLEIFEEVQWGNNFLPGVEVQGEGLRSFTEAVLRYWTCTFQRVSPQGFLLLSKVKKCNRTKLGSALEEY